MHPAHMLAHAQILQREHSGTTLLGYCTRHRDPAMKKNGKFSLKKRETNAVDTTR